MRANGSMLLAGLLVLASGCATVEEETWDPVTACGPEVSRNSVRIIDAKSEFAQGGAAAALARAEQSTGSVQLLDWGLHRSTKFRHLKGQGAKRGCDVIIHVKTDITSTYNRNSHFVLLGRRLDNPVE